MSLDPSIISGVENALETAYDSGRQQGMIEAQAVYYGKSARVLTGNLFATSLQAASQMLRQHDAEAATFFGEKAAEFAAFVTPPTIQSTDPADGATAIATTAVINVKFGGGGIDPGSLTADTLYVYPAAGGSHLAGEVSYDAATCTATFTPTNPLSAQTQYTVVVGAAILAPGGMSLSSDHPFSFTTGDV